MSTEEPTSTEMELTERDVQNTDIKEKIDKRVSELKAEFAAGQKMLTDLDAKASELKTTLLRISGAIQVLEELLAQDAQKEENNADLHGKK